MAKWQFSYTRADGKRGHIKIAASSKVEAIRKGMEHARKHADGETIVSFVCALAQA